ncbi:MAG: nucleoside-diphosphate sugar epimerase/dehydratase [Bacteroidota bacterium]
MIVKRKIESFTTPKWLVFFADLGLLILSLLISYLFRFDFKVPSFEWDLLADVSYVVLSIYVTGFLLLKPYSGMIRYTGSKDLKRIFFTLLGISVTLYMANFLRYQFVDRLFVLPTSVIAIQFFIGLFLLIGMRMFARFLLFDLLIEQHVKSEVIIYGAGQAGNIAKRTIDRDAGSRYKIVAFVDDNPKKTGKRLEGVKIYHSSKIHKIVAKRGVKRLIIAIQRPDQHNRQQIIDFCIDHDIKVLTVPPVQKWINGELSFNQIKQLKIEDLLGRDPIVLGRTELGKFFDSKTVLVTGAAGSIGSEIVRQVLLNRPGKVILLDQAESPLYDLQNELLSEGYTNFEIVIGDVSSFTRMQRLFQLFKPSVVYHAAAYKHVPLMEDNPAEAIRVNIKGTRNLVNLSAEHLVERFVFISTDKAVNPTNVMGATKRVAEMYAQSFSGTCQTKFITTRFGNVLGSNGSVIPVFRRQIEKGGPITITHPDITRYFMTIPEAVSLVLEAALMGEGGEIFIFDMGKSVKILDLARKMLKLSGLEPGRDIEIKFTGLRPGEKLFEELLANEELTVPTHHPKIMIAKVRHIDKDTAIGYAGNLIQQIDSQNNELMVGLIKDIVPEYISKNSVFEKLDSPEQETSADDTGESPENNA